MKKMENRAEEFLSIIGRKLEVTSGKLQKIHESVRRRITGVDERVSHLENSVDIKVNDFEKTFCKTPSTQNSL